MAAGISALQVSHWDEAYTRGNHALMGYLTGLALNNYYTKSEIDAMSSSSVWTTSGTAISYMSGNVGIGIAAPSYKLQMVSDNIT